MSKTVRMCCGGVLVRAQTSNGQARPIMTMRQWLSQAPLPRPRFQAFQNSVGPRRRALGPRKGLPLKQQPQGLSGRSHVK
jgi:hypothetical protein